MKQLKAFLVLFIVGLFLPLAAAAQTNYVIKAGDCLSVIGQRLGINWRQLARQNNIKPPYLIYPGQVLTVPAVTSRAKIYKRAAKTVGKIFFWRHPGANPYGVRNPLRALARFRITEKQRKELLRAWLWNKYGPPREVEIRSGYYLEQMINRGAKVEDNVIARFPAGTVVKAREYVAEVDGARFILIEPYQIINPKGAKPGCYNWGWRIEKIKKKPAPPPKKPQPQAKPQPQPSALRFRPQARRLKFRLSNDTYVFGELCWPIDGRSGWNRYGGFRSNTYLVEYETNLGRLRSGVGVAGGRWEGESASGFRYYGHRLAVGPVIDFSSNADDEHDTTYSLNLFCGFGHQDDKGHTADRKYRANQHTNIINPELGFDYDPPDDHLINKWEGWVGGIVDTDHKKKSSWQGWPIPTENDPPEDKSLIYGGLRLYLVQRHWLKAGVYGKSHYAFGDHSWGKGGGLFISDVDEIVKVSGGPYNISGSRYKENNGTAACLGIDIDAGKLLKKLITFIKNKKNGEEKASSTKNKKKNIQIKPGKQKKVNRDLSLPEEDLDEVG